MGSRYSLLHLRQSLSETTLTVEHHSDDSDDATEHHDALNEVVDGSCLITSQNHIDSCEQCHDDDTIFVRDAEAHVEELGDTAIHTSCVRNEEHESDDGSNDAKSLIAESCAEEIRHGA